MSKKAEKLLGVKRPKPESDSEKSESSNEDKDNKEKPTKSLFNSNEQGFKPGLFGDLSKPNTKPVSLFNFDNKDNKPSSSLFNLDNKDNKQSSSLFNLDNKDNKQTSLFSGTSLFGNLNENKGGFSLFSNTNNSGGLFSNLISKKEDEEEEGDDNIGKSDSPNPYLPEVTNDESKDFKKLFVKKVDNCYVYNKEQNKFVSKGNGFISIETTDKDNKKFGFIMFRNSIGHCLFEGILNEKINKCDSYETKFKYVSHFFFLEKVEKDGQISYKVSNCKIPFLQKDDSQEFAKKYKEAIEFIKEDKKENKDNSKDDNKNDKDNSKDDKK